MTFGNLTKEIKPNIKVYLFVPFRYKDEVKRKGGKFDWLNKTWYIDEQHPNREELADIYQQNNFYENCSGWHRIRNERIKTKEEVQEEEQKLKKKYEELKEQWIQDGKNEEEFELWFCLTQVCKIK